MGECDKEIYLNFRKSDDWPLELRSEADRGPEVVICNGENGHAIGNITKGMHSFSFYFSLQTSEENIFVSADVLPYRFKGPPWNSYYTHYISEGRLGWVWVVTYIVNSVYCNFEL